MKEIYDPVYYPPSLQGFDDYSHHHQRHQQQGTTTQYRHVLKPATPSPSSSSKASTVLGRFLKLGKSKSDASGYATSSSTSGGASRGGGGGGGSSSSQLHTNPEDYEVDEFRLSPSVIARGPVEKMVHKANSRKDVSRSHSWIYGSVKLPQDLPFGYADSFNFHHQLSSSPGGVDMSEGVGGDTDMEQVQERAAGHYLHTHQMQSMNIPRCQLDYYCTCDCGGGGGEDFDHLMMMSSGGRGGVGGSVRGGRMRGGGSGSGGPCQACAREMAMKYALPKRKSGASAQSSESFVSSVRKLTWKSLKQVVKKRPSLDTLKKIPHQSQNPSSGEYLAAPIVPMQYLSSSVSGESSGLMNPMANLNPASPNSHYGNPRIMSPVSPGANHNMIAQNIITDNGNVEPPNYFFPDKKQFYASCNDIYGEGTPPHVTASVRVRPKRTRESWQFPSEFGPVPNYEEDQQLYHSEWDLRQVMSYDVWMSATSNVKPRGAMSPGATSTTSRSSKDPQNNERHYQSNNSIHVPPPDYMSTEPTMRTTQTFRPQQSNRSSEQSKMSSPSKSSTNGSVKMVTTSKSSMSRQSSASLNNSNGSVVSSSSSTSKRSSSSDRNNRNDHANADTLSISSFANTPSNPNKANKASSSSPNNGIVKRSSILAADVTAYQLIKAQQKKVNAQSSPSSQPISNGVQQGTKTNGSNHSNHHANGKVAVATTNGRPILQQGNKSSPKISSEDVADAFSESSDDLSDNAITGSEASSHSNSNSSAGADKKNNGNRRGVRIAGQTIRIAPNANGTTPNGNNVTRKSQKISSTSASSSSTTSVAANKSLSSSSTSSSSQNRTSTFTSYQQQSRSHNQSTSAVRNSAKLSIARQTSSSDEVEDDVWSDCHTELDSMMRTPSKVGLGLGDRSQPNESKSRDREGVMSSVHSNVMKVSGDKHQHQYHHATTVTTTNPSANSNNHKDAKQTFVTFEQPPQSNFEELEFEEYEFDQERGGRGGRGDRHILREPQVKSPPTPTTFSSKDNVVSLNVTRNPLASNGGGSGGGGTYIKHTKGQQSSPSSAAATGKFGALRRRKSRNGPNNPGKLLQETIYEEETEHSDDLNCGTGQSPRSSVPEHSVKIMVSQTTASQTSASSSSSSPAEYSVKPILKNRERTYDTPVVTTITSNNADRNGGSCLNDAKNSSSRLSTFDGCSSTPCSPLSDQQIYFDSSVSTISTASKKKVQFDQSKVVVCGGDSTDPDSYDEENDDSDQWSLNKSDEEDQVEDQRTPQQKQKQFGGNVAEQDGASSSSLPNLSASLSHLLQSQHQRFLENEEKIGSNEGRQDNGSSRQTSSSNHNDHCQRDSAMSRSSFEEEVARKAAQFARSREEAEQLRAAAHAREEEEEEATKKKDVNNLQVYGGEHAHSHQSQSQRRGGGVTEQPQQQQKSAMKSGVGSRNGNNVVMSAKSNSEQQQCNGTNERGAISKPEAIAKKVMTSQQRKGVMMIQSPPTTVERNVKTGEMKSKSPTQLFEKNNANKIGTSQQRVLNPNSLLFNDTTRIRLNQSRPALHETTFQRNGSPQNGKNRVTRLKQSNSFRSVASVPLRPKEPPPPPPTTLSSTGKSSSLASVPARLHKALSTSTLLSKSTEKLNMSTSLSLSTATSSPGSKSGSHYGLGGRLLPSKSQISLPLGLTTTSNQVSKVMTGSVDTLHLSGLSTKSNKIAPLQKQVSTSSSTSKYGRGGLKSKATQQLSARSKSLTEKCEQLEKVLMKDKTSIFKTNDDMCSLQSQLDMDSKNIEIVTKENSVSEIRIYSSTSALPIHPAENLPYQGIIYEATRTVITTTDEKKIVGKSPAEIHYAATDLFPSPPPPKVASPSPAFNHPPLPPLPSSPSKTFVASPPQPKEYESTGKSVVLIIDNSNKGKTPPQSKKPSLPAKKPDSALTYSQPIDTLTSTPGSSPPQLGPAATRALPQIPLPSIPKDSGKKIITSIEPEEYLIEEPLYDDVINHSEVQPPPPQHAPTSISKGKLKGSLGKKSIGLISSGNKYPKLGELPPLPPPPVPPHRSLQQQQQQQGPGQVVSSTLPCPACPPSLPPPNLPSKNLSEFHNRPLVIQENEEEEMTMMMINGFTPGNQTTHPHPQQAAAGESRDLEEEVDNLYNDIGTPTAASSIAQSSSSGGSGTMKSSTAAAFASAMKDAFLGAIKSMDFDRRVAPSTTSSSSSGKAGEGEAGNEQQLIYDDTLSIISASNDVLVQRKNKQNQSGVINHHSNSKMTSSALNFKNNKIAPVIRDQCGGRQNEDEDEEDCTNEPLYDDVLNLTQLETTKTATNECNANNTGEYQSSSSSDSGTEDLPPPLPLQGPPPLPKVSTELPMLPFPLLQNQKSSSSSSSSLGGTTSTLISATIISDIVLPTSTSTTNNNNNTKASSKSGESTNNNNASTENEHVLDRTRSLLHELNEKLSKLNYGPDETSPGTHAQTSSSNSPGSSSSFLSATSSTGGTGGNVEGTSSTGNQNHPDFATYISKVVISPSSESSGVEEDYNSEKNYSLSNGSDASASSSDENYKMTAVSKLVSETISLARGKFLENMKLSMLGQGSPSQEAGSAGPGLLMMTSNSNSTSSPALSSSTRSLEKVQNKSPVDDDEEPIYEEIGENRLLHHTPGELLDDVREDELDLDEDGHRSTSPLYADAFDAKSMFDGASRSEILSFLESIRDRLTGAESTSSSESQSSSISLAKQDPIATPTKSFILDIDSQRQDSGISSESGSLGVPKKGGEEGRSSSPEMQAKQSDHHLCPDCNDHFQPDSSSSGKGTVLSEDSSRLETDTNSSPPPRASSTKPLLCLSCNRKRNEKKEIIMEIYETELKYGRDLRIVSEEFYKPIQIAGLLTKEQLDQIFLNVDQLININFELTTRLKMAISQSCTNSTGRKLVGSESTSTELQTRSDPEQHLSDVNVGKIFIELGESMMTAFENYCTRQASAGALLSQLEKEKELLRIFLRVSQMENTVLRRMNLPAFLMVPVQRVTRYPLLLSRLLKVTPVDHFSREELQLAHEKIEQHLEHMNKTTREVASVKLWRRISIINGNSNSNNGSSAPAHRRSNSDLDTSNIRIRKMAMDVMEWSNISDVTCVVDNQLGMVHFNGKPMRNIYGCLLARGKDLDVLASKIQEQELFFPPAEDLVKDVKLVLVRVKNTRFCLLREPLCLSKCVVSQGENEFQDFIEINEITTKNTYFIQGPDKQSTGTWLKFLQCYSMCVGHWRRRRPALANIMMNGMIKHL